MKNIKGISIAMAGALALFSCGNESEGLFTETDDPVAVIIGEFRSQVSPGSRTGGEPQIISVETKYYKIEGDTVVESMPTKADGDIFDISSVKLRVGDTDGFAILSTDARLNKVFYYTENGSLSDTAFIAPLKEYVDVIPFFAADAITYPEAYTETRASGDQEIFIGPIVPFKWGQWAPFNNLAPACTSGGCDGHMPIGCVTTAAAQTLATIGSFKGTYYGTRDIDFKSLPPRSYNMTAAQKQQVSQFFHEVALCCQVKFGCGASGSYVKSAYQYFKDMGYSCTYTTGNIDCNRLIPELRKGYPHMIGGSDGDGGHMWIVDGIRKSSSATYFSCNWGWHGSSDGWIYGNPYTAKLSSNTTKTYSKNLRHIYIQSKPI